MPEPIEGSYFDWLCAKVKKNRVNVYYALLEILYRTEFYWTVPEDENRAMDGVELRDIFLMETHYPPDPEWPILGCSVLEMLIAFARRAEFQSGMSSEDWFWKFITNLGLSEYRQVSRRDVSVINDILHRFVWRMYRGDGDGGLFPIHRPECDQTKIEILDQFFQYADREQLI